MVERNGVDAHKLLADMRQMTSGTISDLDLMSAGVKASSFGISFEKLPRILDIAKASRATGKDVN